MVKIHLVTGFLGSGKTTLLKRLIEAGLPASASEPSPRQLERFVLLVNEFGDVGIDGPLLKKRGHDVVELTSGCVCCEVSGDMVRAVRDMIDEYRPQRVIMESTGIAEPGRILATLWASQEIMDRARVEPTICVVDTSAFDEMVKTLGYYYYCQVQASDIVILNKLDLVKPVTVKRVEKQVREMNARVVILHATRCEVDMGALFLREQDVQPVTAAHGHHEGVFESFVHEDAHAVLDREALERYLGKLPRDLFRLKGTVRYPDGVHYLNWVNGNWDYEPTDADDPQRTTLVFIGRQLDRDRLIGGLRKCATARSGR